MSPFMGGGPNSALSFIVWAFLIAAILQYIAVRFAIATLLRKYRNMLPAEFRRPPEGLIWLNIIPMLPCLLNFLIFPALANAYSDAFMALKRNDLRALKILSVLAWVYPMLYIVSLMPYVGMSFNVDTLFDAGVFFALLFSDVIVLVIMATQFDALGKYLSPNTPIDASVHPRRENALKWISRD